MQPKATIIFAIILGISVLLTGCLQGVGLFLPQNHGIIEGRAVLPPEIQESRNGNSTPLAGANVYVLEMKTEELVASSKTLKDGTYRITVPAGGPYLVKVEKDIVKLYAPVIRVSEKERKNIGETNLESTALAILSVAKIKNEGTISEEDLSSLAEEQELATLIEEIKKTLQRGTDPLKDDQVINVANNIILPQVDNPTPAIQPQYDRELFTFEAVTPNKVYKSSPFANIDIRMSNPQNDPYISNKHLVVVLEIQGPQELSESSFPPPQSFLFYFKYLGVEEGKWIGYCGFGNGIQGIRVGEFFGANVGLGFSEDLLAGSYTLNFYLVETDGLESEADLLNMFREKTLKKITKKIEFAETIDGLDFEVLVEDLGSINEDYNNFAFITAQVAGFEEETRFGFLFSVHPPSGTLSEKDVGIIPVFSGEGGYDDVAQAISEVLSSADALEILGKYRDDLHYLGTDTTGAWVGYYGCGEGLSGMGLQGISMHGFVVTFSKNAPPGLYNIRIYLVRVDGLSNFDALQSIPQERVLAVSEAQITLESTPFEDPKEPYFGPSEDTANFCPNNNYLYIGYNLYNPLTLSETYLAIRLTGNTTIDLGVLQSESESFHIGSSNPYLNMELVYPENNNSQIEADNLLLVWKLNLIGTLGVITYIYLPLQSQGNLSHVDVYLIDGSSVSISSAESWENFDFEGNCVGKISLPVQEGCP